MISPTMMLNHDTTQWKLHFLGFVASSHNIQGIIYDVDVKASPPKNPNRPPKNGMHMPMNPTIQTKIVRLTARSMTERLQFNFSTKVVSIVSNTGMIKTWKLPRT
ncbi:hypothetical protein V8G54_027255 [Vigna mungo]|uniref:Uncharacterized protein n=1 Tax=Vigna mungo TaxID=3915 RepID=A0AAQ3RR77_VIGMU